MKIICVGRNYPEHIEELKNERPAEPVLFMKPDTAVLPEGQDFYIPDFSRDLHYEAEIIVKIAKAGKYIEREFAQKYYREISLGIDFTARDLQNQLKDKGLPWEKAKAFDGAAVIGTWLPKEQFQYPHRLGFHLTKNGTTVQSGNTQDMLWKIDELIAHISTYFTLRTGDVIFTGTPAGIGAVAPGDSLKGFVEHTNVFSVYIR